ncbi:hypothetical protein IHQ71_11790 [Rhizobium sp. TH2]|uniref:HNH endonuclease n=1 Tax=Rhizobium sp. TH2 TaxID=2775403 RepID=UPI0021572949|nr:hypothetical protein [Rhizobium sp. TH2]UVC11189.1 hypothetical protein IHQ71_11790 [Rhizobium sp. TH2]
MSGERKQPSTEVRQAIWEAWDKKSAYTGEPVAWPNLHVDHVIPVKKPKLLADLQSKRLAPADFDINGFENLLPSANFQNQGKSAKQMEENALVYYLELARQKKPEIQRRLAARYRSNAELKAYLDLKAASEKNDVSLEEMLTVFAHRAEGAVTLRITPAIEGANLATANSSVAATLMDRPFALGGGTVTEVIVHSSNGHSLTCTTSNEFIRAQQLGYFALTQTDIKIASMASETTEALRAIRDSTFADESELREPIVKLRHLDRWAAEWVAGGLVDHDDLEKIAGLKTISDVVDAGLCKVESLEDHEVSFIVHHGLDVTLRELMRADLDGDRWEEILIFNYMSAARNGGTLGGGQAFMAKIAEDGLLHMQAYPPEKTE